MLQQNNIFQKQQGVALMTALLIMVIVGIIAAAVSTAIYIDIRRTELSIHHAELYQADQGVLYWGQQTLLAEANSSPVIQAVQQFSVSDFHGMNIQGKLIDLQAKLNINNLSNTLTQAQFIQLLQSAAGLAKAQATQLCQAIVETLLKNATHTTANALVYNNIQALQFIPNMTPKILAAISPYITALPYGSLLNINTASIAVLQTLANGITLADANKINNIRNQSNGFASVDQMRQNPQLSQLAANLNSAELSVMSQYFLIEATVHKKEQSLTVNWLLRRDINQNHVTLYVLWERHGVLAKFL